MNGADDPSPLEPGCAGSGTEEPTSPTKPISPTKPAKPALRLDLDGAFASPAAGDESTVGWGDREDSRESEFLRDVPPHHG